MRLYLLLILCLCTACLVVFSGCSETTTGGTPPTTTQIVTTPIITPTQVSGYLVPGPTQTMPPGKDVRVDVIRDQTFPTITVTYRGGEGQIQVREMIVKLTRQDGTTETKQVSKPAVGAEVTFDGTKGKDRIEVTITTTMSQEFKIIDKVYDFYQHL